MYKPPIATIAQRLQELMEKRGINQTELAEKTGIPRTNINRYVQGIREPKQDIIGTIAEVFKIDPAWLLGFDTPMHQKNLPSEEAKKDFALLDKFHQLTSDQQELIERLIDEILKK